MASVALDVSAGAENRTCFRIHGVLAFTVATLGIIAFLVARWWRRANARSGARVLLPHCKVSSSTRAQSAWAALQIAVGKIHSGGSSRIAPVGAAKVVAVVQPLQVQQQVCSASSVSASPMSRSEQGARTLRSLHFKPTVSCCSVPNLCESCGADQKAELWWQANDFAEFLRVRVALGRAYRAVAKRRGVKIDTSTPPEPAWAHESRRGLALGRKRLREKNRQLYIKAVLEEQSRQRAEMLLAAQASPTQQPVTFLMDVDKLAEVARQFSARDRCYAAEQAKKEYERTLQSEAYEKKGFPALISGTVVAGTWTEIGKGAAVASPQQESPSKQPGPYSPSSDAYPLVRSTSFLLLDSDSEERVQALGQGKHNGGSIQSIQRNVSPESRSSSKGFGLSRDDLEQAGLTVTGHLLRRRRGQGADSPSGAAGGQDGGDSDASVASDACGDSDCSEPFSP
mmetsp:Transcript_4390/g.11946  ORF Transcript_4390/g.11946 Transcript_4390/m.11946 type:complete len:455 (+) Transcript_4390:68-1432(+)